MTRFRLVQIGPSLGNTKRSAKVFYSSIKNDDLNSIPINRDTSPNISQINRTAGIDLAIKKQAPNRAATWSESQRPREEAMTGPRFTGIDILSQPQPLAAIELLKQQPVTKVQARNVACDGGDLLGHPKVFINLVGAFVCLPYGMI